MVLKYNDKFKENEVIKLNRFDSTIISLSGKLLKDGLNLGGKAHDRHIRLLSKLDNDVEWCYKYLI
ncbi:hypothetical protein [Candidatus Tisiphia endosymbiont of Dioctria rufipes]|uniref:hypothetical protein n=1 Tax=Candidatus Tisiphia endosymbiont of Dioctria rufipes TaxID=3066255 RepID=UPI00312C8954